MTTMNPALKLYLDKLHAETKAQYAEIHKQLQLQEALFSKFDTGASTPQSVVTSDGGLTVDATAVAAVPDVSCSTTKAQEVLEVIHDAPPGYITMAPVTCSTDCSNQVVATDIVNEVHDVNEVRDATTAIFPEPAIDPNGKAVKQPTPVISADVDHSDLAALPLTMCLTKCSHRDTNILRYALHPAVTPSWLVLRPKPWPSFWRDHADGNEKRPMPWPSLACSHELYRKHVELLSQITSSMNHFSGALNSLRESGKYLQSMQLKLPWPSFKYHSDVGYPEEPCSVSCCQLISMEEAFSCLQVIQFWQYLPDDTWLQPWPSWKFQSLILSVMTSPLKKCDYQDLLSAGACNLDKGCLKCHIFRREINSKLLLPSGVQCEQPMSYFEFGSAQAYLKLNEVCAAALYLFEDYLSMWSELPIGELTTDSYYSAVRNIGSPVPISVDDSGSVKLIEHQFLVVHEQLRQWAWCFCIEKLWSTKYLACKSQEQGHWKCSEHHILEYVVVGGIPIPHKLQETVQVMTVSIQRQFLSEDTFKWSGHFAGSFISFALGRAMLTSFYIDSSKRSSKQFGDLLVHQTCLMVKHTVSLQPWSSNTRVPCFTCFASRSRHLSRLHFHAYQNGSSFRMSWDPVNHIMSNLEKPFSCFQGTQLQSWRPPDRTLSCAIQSSRDEAIHWEQVHYKDLQFYPHSLEHPLEGDENFIPYQTAYGFDLEMIELVSNMWKSDHGWVVRLYLVQRHYMLLGILCSTPDCTLHVSIKSWFEQQKGRSYNWLAVAELTLRPMHMRILQAVEIFRELTSAITTESYTSGGSFVHSDRVRKRGVQHNNTVEGNKIKSNCSLCSDTHLVGIRLLMIELESYILADSESTQYACITWMSHEFASSRPATHPVHEFSSILSRASTVQWVARKHLPLFRPKPPWPIPVPPSFLPEFRGNRRTSSELVHLIEVLVELTQFWAFVDPISTSPNHWWCFYWRTPAAYLIFALDGFGYNNKASQQEISWNSGSSPTGYILHDHCCRYPCGIAEELNSRRVQSTERSNEHRTIQSVLLAISSCAQWDPGGLDFADIQSLQIPCSMPRLAGCTSHRPGLVFIEQHSYESTENGHRLGGKPVVKEEGMSATQLLPRPHQPASPPRATSTWAGPVEN